MEDILKKDLLAYRSRLDELKAKGVISSYDEDPEDMGDGVYVFTVYAQWEDIDRYMELFHVISNHVSSEDYENLILFNLKPAQG